MQGPLLPVPTVGAALAWQRVCEKCNALKSLKRQWFHANRQLCAACMQQDDEDCASNLLVQRGRLCWALSRGGRPSWQPFHQSLSPCCARAALVRSRQEALDALPADYFAEEWDPVAGELALLPRMFTEADLEAVVEERSAALEASMPHQCSHPHASLMAQHGPLGCCWSCGVPGSPAQRMHSSRRRACSSAAGRLLVARVLQKSKSMHLAQVVSERLSQHVLDNYSKFVAGVTEVASVERDLQARAHLQRLVHAASNHCRPCQCRHVGISCLVCTCSSSMRRPL